MSCIGGVYTGRDGFYAAVKPLTHIPVPVVSAPPELGFEPLAPSELHITVGFDDSAAVPRDKLEQFLADRRIEPSTQWRAGAVGAPQWWESKGKVYLGIHFYSPDLHSLHESLKSLGVVSTFDQYMCHMTFGRWKNIPPELRSDRQFMNAFVKAYVSADIPNIITTSQLEITNAK